MNKKFISIAFITIFSIIFIGAYKIFSKKTISNSVVLQSSCVLKTEERVVRGNSLSGLIEPGQTIKILFGFYNCNEIKREDVIAYNYAGNPEPIIKIVKGLDGDKFHLQKTDNSWDVLINDEIVKNSFNQPYVLDEKSHKMLLLYEQDYKGIIPQNAYLILGNAANGTLDSSVFGLIDKSDILGKVVK